MPAINEASFSVSIDKNSVFMKTARILMMTKTRLKIFDAPRVELIHKDHICVEYAREWLA